LKKGSKKLFCSPCGIRAVETAESPKRMKSFFASFCSQKEVLACLT
jgi:hypothetical protein